MKHVDISFGLLFTLLALAFVLCAFCAASETGLLSLNRYRLRHLAKSDPRAKRISHLLAKPDRLLGAILIGNTFATAVGSSISNEIAGKLWGEIGIWLSPIIFTLLLLVIAEVTPKTLAAIKPEQTSKFVSYPLQIMLWILYPLIWLTTILSNAFLRLFGVHVGSLKSESLNREELRTVVNEASGLIPAGIKKCCSHFRFRKSQGRSDYGPRNEVIGP